MRTNLLSRAGTRAAALALATGAVAMGATGIASAGGAAKAQKAPNTLHITATLKGNNLSWSPSSSTISNGGTLILKNATNPSRIGPHTFALVKHRDIPQSKSAENKCFSLHHICRKIAKWHKADFQTQTIHKPIVHAGHPGWNRMGTLKRKGDSWFTQHHNETFIQPVNAKPGTVLHFMCAIHPFMQGTIRVKK